MSYLGSQLQQEQTPVFLVMFDGFGCSCGLPHCVIHVQRLSLSEFTALGKFKNKKHHSKLFMLNSQICKSYRRSESKYYFFAESLPVHAIGSGSGHNRTWGQLVWEAWDQSRIYV